MVRSALEVETVDCHNTDSILLDAYRKGEAEAVLDLGFCTRLASATAVKEDMEPISLILSMATACISLAGFSILGYLRGIGNSEFWDDAWYGRISRRLCIRRTRDMDCRRSNGLLKRH